MLLNQAYSTLNRVASDHGLVKTNSSGCFSGWTVNQEVVGSTPPWPCALKSRKVSGMKAQFCLDK